MRKITKEEAITAFKVFNSDWTCSPNGERFQYAVGAAYHFDGSVKVCGRGFHACTTLGHCFSYYAFDKTNKVAEVRIWGSVDAHGGDSKLAASDIEIVRELSWEEVLKLANTGSDNTGHSNSGNWNSGNWNSGNWNSGNWNSGDRNSGNWNSGDRNSGDRNSGNWNSGNWNSGNWNSGYRNSGNWNSGYRNSGNWNSGDRNSGDQNSGYRNSGAFCTDSNPFVTLFDLPTNIHVRDWERHPAVVVMERNLETHIWIYANSMTDVEKEAHPHWETTDGHLKALSLKEAWGNMWPNLDDASKKVFISLPNFDAKKFEAITGISVKTKK